MPTHARGLYASNLLNFIFYGILGVGLAIRVIYLGSDPPVDLAKGQSLWTDPSQYVFFARNFVTFGSMDLFIPSNLTFFKYSLISFLSIPVFLLFGSGFWQSNFVSIIVAFCAVFIFSKLIRNLFGNSAGIFAALFSGLAYIFVMHNRVPYLENPSIMLIILSSYLFLSKNQNKTKLFWSGFIYSGSLFMGKTLAILAFPAFIITLWSLNSRISEALKILLQRILFFGIGMASFSLLVLVAFYLPNYIASKEYLYENVISYYGFPDGFKSIASFIKSLYTYDLVNFENRFFDRIPVIVICCILFFVLVKLKNNSPERKASLFFSGWLICGYLFLSPWNYRPIRYEMYLFLPLVALASIFLSNLLKGNIKFNRVSFVKALFLFSLASFHIYYYLSKANYNQYYPFWRMFVFSFLISAIISLIIYFLFIFVINRQYILRISFVIMSITLSLLLDLRLYYKWINNATYRIEYINRNLPRQIAGNAIIMGPYAQTITLGNTIRSEIFYYGAYAKYESLFSVVPATHAVYEISMGGKSGNEIKFQEYYPEIYRKSILIDSYLIGRYYVNIYNVSSATDVGRERPYQWSNFEKAMRYYNEGSLDSAMLYFDKAEREEHLSRASLYKGILFYRLQLYDKARIEYQKGLNEDCYDPKFWMLYSFACQRAGFAGESKRARDIAKKYEPFPEFINTLKL